MAPSSVSSVDWKASKATIRAHGLDASAGKEVGIAIAQVEQKKKIKPLIIERVVSSNSLSVGHPDVLHLGRGL